VNYTDDDAFRVALEALPCCATNEDGSKNVSTSARPFAVSRERVA
jgi:hypothetical protein